MRKALGSDFTLPQRRTLEGTYETKLTAGGEKEHFIKTDGSTPSLYRLASGSFKMEELESIDADNTVKVNGKITFRNPPFIMKVDHFYILRTGSVVHLPPVELQGKTGTPG